MRESKTTASYFTAANSELYPDEFYRAPSLIEKWLDIYAKKTTAELPALEARVKTLDAEIQTQNRRVENLVARLADLPQDIPADPIYAQIKACQEKLSELKKARVHSGARSHEASNRTIDRCIPAKRRFVSEVAHPAHPHKVHLRRTLVEPARSFQSPGQMTR